MNKQILFVGVILAGVGLLISAGILYFNKKGEKKDMMDMLPPYDELNEKPVNKNTLKEESLNGPLTEREIKELRGRIIAMTHEELMVIMDVIPADYCMMKIQNELNKAAEMQKSIERAYEMVKQ